MKTIERTDSVTDRDKRLEEIRRELGIANAIHSMKFMPINKSHVEFLLEEIKRLQLDNTKLNKEIAAERLDSNTYQVTCGKLADEVSQLREERDTLKEALSAVIEQERKDSVTAGKTIQEITDEARRWLRERNALVEERDKLKEALTEIEDESSREDADLTRINGITQDTLRALGIGEES